MARRFALGTVIAAALPAACLAQEPVPRPSPPPAAEPAPLSDAELREAVRKLQEQVAELRAREAAAAPQGEPGKGPVAPAPDGSPSVAPGPPPLDGANVASVPAPAEKPKESSWYDRISLRGYVQFRTHVLASDRDEPWFHPADRSVSNSTTFLIRRGRVILSGQVTDHLFVYIQPDLNAAPGDGDFAVQLRDLYADVSIDDDKEFRFRIGQSKVPYGFVNLQSSQNRAPLERPEALNSAVEGERDIGVYFYWAPRSVRETFKQLVSKGLKGSGDYGVFGLGAYSGQGLNRLDLNKELHYIARVSYPIELGGQVLELGAQGYIGRFVPRSGSIPRPPGTGAGNVTPDFPGHGLEDQRIAFTAVLYPQPFGFEVEWTVGRGPELVRDATRIGVERLHGGYAQVHMKLDSEALGTFFPFVRWQYFEGARKFARNAPRVHLREIDGGLEWSPIKEIELTVVYTYTVERTDTSTAPFGEITDAHRVGFQLQWNF